MDGRDLWLRWRRDIVRGAVIFGLVVGVGLAVRSMAHGGREKLDALGQAFNPDFLAADRQRGAPWTYAAPLAARRTLWLRNINGPITVEPADGPKVEVLGERTFKHSSADSVRILTVESGLGLTVCAVWPGKATQCGPDGHYSTEGGLQGNDVAVEFTVRLPRGVKLDASTVNGDIEVSGATAPVGVGTVNGDLTVETALGPVRAASVNGDVQATIHGFAEPGDVNVVTVHGDVTVELPPGVDAELEGHTVTGDISTDFPLTVTGKFASHAVTGRIGNGGRRIRLNTVAGDVQVRKQGAADVPAIPTPPTPAPGTRRSHPGTP